MTTTRLTLGVNSAIHQLTLPDDVAVSDEEYAQLWSLKPAVRGTVRLYGKTITTPRSELNLGREYTFSGVTHPVADVSHPVLARLLAFTSTHSGIQGWSQMLLNFYDDGTQYISDHRDNEPELLPGAPIYSFSFGASRDFVVKPWSDPSVPERLVMTMKNNTCVVMLGDMQQHYTHGVPKRLRVKDSRINVTLRLYKDT